MGTPSGAVPPKKRRPNRGAGKKERLRNGVTTSKRQRKKARKILIQERKARGQERAGHMAQSSPDFEAPQTEMKRGTALRQRIPDLGRDGRIQDTPTTDQFSRGPGETLHSPAVSGSSLPESSAGAMAWNPGGPGATIRTSLRSSESQLLGRNRLATGFPAPASAASPASLESGETQDDAIEISSDSEEDSEGGMVINVEGQGSAPEYDSGEDEEMEDSNNAVSISSSDKSSIHDEPNAHMQLQGDLERHLSSGFRPLSIDENDLRGSKTRLADLNSNELELQFKYSLFHLKRDQIDLARPTICTSCLREGHIESSCPEKTCTRCEAPENNHASRKCPKFRRCLKCRERGHDVAYCKSKLKVVSAFCDYCGSNRHLEDQCTMRFFPVPAPVGNANVKLWISCCNCASKTHLIGDCPAIKPDIANRWSLKSLDPNQVTNMSLETGTRKLEKEAENRGMRPEGLSIRGRAERGYRGQGTRRGHNEDEEEEESFFRPPVRQRQPNTSANTGSDPIDPRRPTSQYLPAASSRYDRYDAPSDDRPPDPRSRGEWYSTDSFGRRHRSRSPEAYYSGGRDNHRNDYPPQRSYDDGKDFPRRYDGNGPPGSRHQPIHSGPGDHWQPPLPSGPPPANETPLAKRTRRKHKPNKAGIKNNSYRPMPSAAKQAWDRSRL